MVVVVVDGEVEEEVLEVEEGEVAEEEETMVSRPSSSLSSRHLV